MDFGMDLNIDVDGRMAEFWEQMREEIQQMKPDAQQLKAQELPLARIKKIMKLDEDVKMMMISAEAPVLLAKAAEIFVRELTLRAWLHTERCRRRTLQRIDISSAIYDSNTDQFDFLIDIVPREEVKSTYGIRRPTTMDESGQLNYDSPSQVGGQTLTLHDASQSLQQQSSGGGGSYTQQTAQIVSGGSGGTIIQAIPSSGMVTTNPGGMTTQQIVINATDASSLGQQVLTSGGQQQQTIQYVLQLPSSSSLGNQPIQIQVIPPNTYTLGDGQMNQGPQLIQLVPQVISLPATVNSQTVAGQPTVITTTGQHNSLALQQVLGQPQIVYATTNQQVQGQQIVMTSQTPMQQTVTVVAKQEPSDVTIMPEGQA